jgi:putative pyruvate formate lyase activating enzyme
MAKKNRDQWLKILADEPLQISVVEDDLTHQLSFSDVPERIIVQLKKELGAKEIEAMITPTPLEKEWMEKLEISDDNTPRYVKAMKDGSFAKKIAKTTAPPTATYFMACINRSDEAILGRTGVLYMVCRKGCHFCQYKGFRDYSMTIEQAAEKMLAFQAAGADNVQWLSPSGYTKFLVHALYAAAKEGLTIPVVHKSEGEDSLDDLALLDGLVDVYVPDAKFIRPEFAPKIGLNAQYGERMKACIKEMYRQVGRLKRKKDKHVAASGVLVRHLLMPTGGDEAKAVLEYLEQIDIGLPVHVMASYEPLNDAKNVPAIASHVSKEEIDRAAHAAWWLEMPRVFLK